MANGFYKPFPYDVPMNTKARHILALVLDVATVIMVVVASIMMFNYGGNALAVKGIYSLRYFTVQSNMLLGAILVIALPFDVSLLLGKRNESPLPIRVLNLVGTIGTTITMLTVLFFLGPTMGYAFMFSEANLLFHLLIPIAGLIRVIFFEGEGDSPKWQVSFFGLIHLFGYGLFYLFNVAIHNGYGQTDYDWYGFGTNGLGIAILTFVIMLVGAFFLTWGLLMLQRKVRKPMIK